MQRPDSRSLFGSGNAFNSLHVDEVEDSSDDDETQPIEVIEPPPAPKVSSLNSSANTKPTVQPSKKDKKANRLSSAERKQLKNGKGPVLGSVSDAINSSANAQPQSIELASSSPAAPVGSQSNPLPIPDDDSTVDPIEKPHVVNGDDTDQSSGDASSIPIDSSVEVIGADGRSHQGNLHIRVTSSEAIIPAPEPTTSEKIIEAITAPAPKRSNVGTRTLMTIVMIGGFIGLLLMGHIYMIILVFMCQTIVYREVTTLFPLSHREPADLNEEERRDPWSKTLNWYFFAVTNYFLYGETIIYYFKHVVFADALFVAFATNHRFISFTLYCIGFVGFVTSLKKQHLKRQFSLFGWVHMTLLLIVVSSHFVVNNILEGLIWFWVPASLVICNDVWAYIWGVTTGRTPLIALSPKKTVEGFVGALFSTIIFGYFWGTFFMRFPYLTCPVYDLGVTAFDNVVCKPNPVFVWREWRVPIAIVLPLIGRINTIWWAPYQFHVLVMACFASLVAPFGGFFASGFKRAFNIKDFGDSIPGHGGMTDRMDCQFLMGLFSYVYYSTAIRQDHVTVGSILQSIVSSLTVEEQLQLYNDLKRFLEARGVPNV